MGKAVAYEEGFHVWTSQTLADEILDDGFWLD